MTHPTLFALLAAVVLGLASWIVFDVARHVVGRWLRRALAGIGYGDITEGPQE